jgi:hypothetical protein
MTRLLDMAVAVVMLPVVFAKALYDLIRGK